MKCLAAVLISVSILGVSGAEAARIRYVGKAWSTQIRATQRNRLVLFQTADPSQWTGTFRCWPLTPGARCLSPRASVSIHFLPNGQFEGSLGGTVCDAAGMGTPTSALNGSYSCVNGDRGTFYFRRIR